MTKKTNNFDRSADWLSKRSIILDRVAKLLDSASYDPQIIANDPFFMDTDFSTATADITAPAHMQG
jgi:hypothetical protein